MHYEILNALNPFSLTLFHKKGEPQKKEKMINVNEAEDINKWNQPFLFFK